MVAMSNTTKENIEKIIQMPLEKAKELSAQEELEWVEKICGKKIIFSKQKRKGIIGRGNPFIARKKIRTMEDVEDKISKIIKK